MAHRICRGAFERFAQARMAFVRAALDMSEQPEFLEPLLKEGAVEALLKMLDDSVTSVRTSAATALARMAAFSSELAEQLLVAGVLAGLLQAMDAGTDPSPDALVAGCTLIRCLAKHGEEHAEQCAAAGSMGALVPLLDSVTPAVREAAAAAIAVLGSHSVEHARLAIDAGAARPLVHCAATAGASVPLAVAALQALGTVGGWDREASEASMAAGAAPVLLKLLGHGEGRVRRASGQALAALLEHSPATAQCIVVEQNGAPALLRALGDAEAGTARNAATALREACKFGGEVCRRLSAVGGAAALVEYICPAATAPDAPSSRAPSDRLSAVIALGFLVAQGEAEAEELVRVGGLVALKAALLQEGAPAHCQAAAAWSITQCGRQGGRTAAAMAQLDLLRHVAAPLTLGAQTAWAQGRAAAAGRTAGGGGRTTSRAAAAATGTLGTQLQQRGGGTLVGNGAARDVDAAAHTDLLEKCSRCIEAVVPHCPSVPALQAALAPDLPDAVTELLLLRIAALLCTPAPARDNGGIVPLRAASPPQQEQGGGPVQEGGEQDGAPPSGSALLNRKGLLASGGLKLVQALRQSESGGDTPTNGPSRVNAAVEAVNRCFPPEVVAYFQPEYLSTELAGRVQ